MCHFLISLFYATPKTLRPRRSIRSVNCLRQRARLSDGGEKREDEEYPHAGRIASAYSANLQLCFFLKIATYCKTAATPTLAADCMHTGEYIFDCILVEGLGLILRITVADKWTRRRLKRERTKATITRSI